MRVEVAEVEVDGPALGAMVDAVVEVDEDVTPVLRTAAFLGAKPPPVEARRAICLFVVADVVVLAPEAVVDPGPDGGPALSIFLRALALAPVLEV